MARLNSPRTSIAANGSSALIGDVVLVPGTNVSVTQSNHNITIDTNSNIIANNPSTIRSWIDDFDASSSTGTTNWGGNSTNGGASQIDGTEILGHPGVTKLSTGTNTNGIGNIYKDNSQVFGRGTFDYEVCVSVDTLSNSTDTFSIEVGASDGYNTSPVNGAWFSYTHSVNAGNWTVNCGNGTTTSADTGVAVTTLTFTKLRILANSAGTSVGFYINGVLKATITNNIATALVNRFGFTVQIRKSAGTNSRIFYIDYARLIETLNVAR